MNSVQLFGVILFFVGILIVSITSFWESELVVLCGVVLGVLGFLIVLISVIVERFNALKEGDLQ